MFKGSKIEYSVSREGFDYTTQKYDVIVARCMDITIKANSEEECYNLLTSLCEYMEVSESTCACCEEIKEGLFELTECITIEDREQYNELKDLYKEWKKQAKDVTVPVVENTTEVEPTEATNQTIVTEVQEPINEQNNTFSFDKIYHCSKVETAINKAKEDISKLNGDVEYLNLDIDYIKKEIELNGKFKVVEIDNYIIEIEPQMEIGWYVFVKYQVEPETTVTPSNNSIDFDSIGKKVKVTYKAPCDTITVTGTIYDMNQSQNIIYVEGVNQYGVEDIWEYNINSKNLTLEILKE